MKFQGNYAIVLTFTISIVSRLNCDFACDQVWANTTHVIDKKRTPCRHVMESADTRVLNSFRPLAMTEKLLRHWRGKDKDEEDSCICSHKSSPVAIKMTSPIKL